MRDVLEALKRWSAEGEEIAIATLLRVRGSAPRPAGARFAMTRSGGVAGSVSGGCIEGDLYERGLRVLDGAPAEIARYGFADEDALEVGLSCGGTIDVLVQRFEADAAFTALRDAIEAKRAVALAVGVAPEAIRGMRAVVGEGGVLAGGITSSLDAALAARVAESLARGPGARVLADWPAPDAGAELYVEVIVPPLELFVVGATHTAVPLCRMAKLLGFHVTLVDPRSAFASRERFPDVDAIVGSWPDRAFAETSLCSASFVVTLTHDPKFDIPAMAAALSADAHYIGALGSRATHARRRQRLSEQGFDDAVLDRIRAPVGLDVGARTPEEVAVAILAEMVAVHHGRAGGALRERTAPIHDR